MARRVTIDGMTRELDLPTTPELLPDHGEVALKQMIKELQNDLTLMSV
ncbi:MAG: hypothetical protein HY731_13870, partial [Candidatus Tectomicrobia bacterium]|nr:hypothetical protein [Candidatus Tectomicrobia bacterium]